MVGKNNWLKILAIMFMFVMTIAGCDSGEEKPPAMLRIRNESTFTIRYITFEETSGSHIKSDRVNLGQSQSKIYDFSYERNISVILLVSVDNVDVEFKRSSIAAISDKTYINVLILRGASKETLALTSTVEKK